MTRRQFLHASAVFTAAAVTGHSHSHRQVNEAPLEAAVDNGPLPTGVTGGSGDFRFAFVPDKLVLPPEAKVLNGHGLCLDKEGNIYFTFEPQKIEEQTRCLVRFAPDGTGATMLGSNNTLVHGTPHGLSSAVEKDGRGVLYHANNDGTIHKTTLDGQILWTQKWSPQMGNYKPTDAVALGGERVVVADGYGSSMLHVLNAADGIYAGKSWGGMGTAHGELNCPHGITFDPRRQLLLIADRTNKRLEYFTLNGFYQGTIEAKEITAPCNADVRGDDLLVPVLNGPLVILDKDNKVVSVIEQRKLLGEHGFLHPHDAVWLANGDIAVCTWNPGRIGYWR